MMSTVYSYMPTASFFHSFRLDRYVCIESKRYSIFREVVMVLVAPLIMLRERERERENFTSSYRLRLAVHLCQGTNHGKQTQTASNFKQSMTK